MSLSFLPRQSPSFAKGLAPHFNHYSIVSPTMSTHTHPVSTRRIHVPIELEIVDDSEPERIEIRKGLNKRPRTSVEDLQFTSTIIQNNFRHHVNQIPVIEISDSESQSSILSPKYTKDIDDRVRVQVQSTVTGAYERTLYGLKPSSACPLHAELPTAIHRCRQRPSEEDEPCQGSSKLSLDCFMFQSSRTPRNLQVSANLVPPTNAMPSGNIKGSKQKRLLLNLSVSDVAKISHCVCCNVQWTARKSGAQKMTHIQSCAKKHALDDATVSLLIQKEITPEESLGKKTFFEDILVGAAPKQKVKRRKKEESALKIVSASRDAILARAQGILSTSAEDCKHQNGSTFTGLTQSHRDLPSTQAFGRSDLGKMQTSERKISSLYDHCRNISGDDVSHDLESSEAQLTFLTSCLESRPLNVFGDNESHHNGSRLAGDSFGDESGVETNYVLNPKRPSPSSMEGRGLISARVPKTPIPDSPSKLCNFTNSTIHLPTPALKYKNARKAKSQLDVFLHSDGSDRATPKKKIGRSKETSSNIAHQFNEEWQLHMIHNIMLDGDLHSRVLHYEPIHFDVFLEIAICYAPLSSKLKRHLRVFLDDQAITFYGEATTKRQR